MDTLILRGLAAVLSVAFFAWAGVVWKGIETMEESNRAMIERIHKTEIDIAMMRYKLERCECEERWSPPPRR